MVPSQPAGASPGVTQGQSTGQFVYARPGVIAPEARVLRHLRTLATLWAVLGAWHLIGGLLGVFFMTAVTRHGLGSWGIPFPGEHGFPQAWMGFMVPVIAGATVISAGLAFATAYGLFQRTRWGRLVAIIAAILALFKFPFGTALGIYTLWVLAPGTSAAEYDYLAATSGN